MNAGGGMYMISMCSRRVKIEHYSVAELALLCSKAVVQNFHKGGVHSHCIKPDTYMKHIEAQP